jgi:GNAT superfamily N-acetyltransferase
MGSVAYNPARVFSLQPGEVVWSPNNEKGKTGWRRYPRETWGSNLDNKNDIPIHMATVHDIPVLVAHHHKMFKEIWIKLEFEIDTHQFEAMDKAHEDKLREEITNGTCRAWVIGIGNKIVASGAISIDSMTPTPYDFSYKVAYLHSIYTEPEYRNRGFAECITKEAMVYCKSQGIRRMILEASDAGRSIYEKVGFQPSGRTMRLWME